MFVKNLKCDKQKKRIKLKPRLNYTKSFTSFKLKN